MKKRVLNISLILLMTSTGKVLAQQGFGTNTPDKSAAVDISSTNKGLLIPRMNLTWNSTDSKIVAPITAPAQGLLVYNKTGIDEVPEGFYYFSAGKWHPIRTSVLNNGTNTTVSGTGTATDPYKVNVAKATTTEFGVVRIGSGIDFDSNGAITVPAAPGETATTLTQNATTGLITYTPEGGTALATTANVLSATTGNLISYNAGVFLKAEDIHANQKTTTVKGTMPISVTPAAANATGNTEYTVSANVAKSSEVGVVKPGTGLTVTGDGTLNVNFPTPDGSETVVTAGSNVSVSGSGTTAAPYVISSSYVDTNTKNKTLAVSGTDLVLTDTENSTVQVALTDLDKQQLSLTGNTLALTNGGDVDLSAYLDNTDEQKLSLTGNTLALTNGGSVDLSALAVDTNSIVEVEGKKDAKAKVVVTPTTDTTTDTTTYEVEVKNAMPTFFYMPSVLIDTAVATPVDLYAAYTDQFGSPAVTSAGAEATSIPTFTVEELDFYVTYYDTNVIKNVTISDTGVMTYTIIGAPTNLSFVNVVFKVRQTPKQP